MESVFLGTDHEAYLPRLRFELLDFMYSLKDTQELNQRTGLFTDCILTILGDLEAREGGDNARLLESLNENNSYSRGPLEIQLANHDYQHLKAAPTPEFLRVYPGRTETMNDSGSSTIYLGMTKPDTGEFGLKNNAMTALREILIPGPIQKEIALLISEPQLAFFSGREGPGVMDRLLQPGAKEKLSENLSGSSDGLMVDVPSAGEDAQRTNSFFDSLIKSKNHDLPLELRNPRDHNIPWLFDGTNYDANAGLHQRNPMVQTAVIGIPPLSETSLVPIPLHHYGDDEQGTDFTRDNPEYNPFGATIDSLITRQFADSGKEGLKFQTIDFSRFEQQNRSRMDLPFSNPGQPNPANYLVKSERNTATPGMINFHAPLIGNFSVQANDIPGCMEHLREKVEEVLLDVLYSVNAIQ